VEIKRLASGAVKSILVGSVAPCCLVDMYLYFGGMCCLPLRGGIISQGSKLMYHSLLLSVFYTFVFYYRSLSLSFFPSSLTLSLALVSSTALLFHQFSLPLFARFYRFRYLFLSISLIASLCSILLMSSAFLDNRSLTLRRRSADFFI
jgi:hypothetical protein